MHQGCMNHNSHMQYPDQYPGQRVVSNAFGDGPQPRESKMQKKLAVIAGIALLVGGCGSDKNVTDRAVYMLENGTAPTFTGIRMPTMPADAYTYPPSRSASSYNNSSSSPVRSARANDDCVSTRYKTCAIR